jgi:hypothetical protein
VNSIFPLFGLGSDAVYSGIKKQAERDPVFPILAYYFLGLPSALKMETLLSSDTSVNFY